VPGSPAPSQALKSVTKRRWPASNTFLKGIFRTSFWWICAASAGVSFMPGGQHEAHERLPAPPRLSATVLLPMDRPCVCAPERWSHRPSLSGTRRLWSTRRYHPERPSRANSAPFAKPRAASRRGRVPDPGFFASQARSGQTEISVKELPPGSEHR
jgi:hypothetical protein